MLATTNINLKHVTSNKFKQRFVGPFKITAKKSNVTYQLALPSSWKIHNVFHSSLLKRYTPSDNVEEEEARRSRPQPCLINGEEEYEVKTILSKRTKRNKTQYLVEWLGYPIYDATWEPIEHLHNAKDLVEQFEQSSMNGAHVLSLGVFHTQRVSHENVVSDININKPSAFKPRGN